MSQDFEDFKQTRQAASERWRTMKETFDKATDATVTKVREATHERLVKLAGGERKVANNEESF